MVNRITFKNNSEDHMELLIEPSAEFINLNLGSEITIETNRITDKYNDELSMTIEKNLLIIYETRQCLMRIYLDDELVYDSKK